MDGKNEGLHGKLVYFETVEPPTWHGTNKLPLAAKLLGFCILLMTREEILGLC